MGRGQATGGSATAIRAPLAEESDSSSADADRSDLLELLSVAIPRLDASSDGMRRQD